jgi:hypothetical protein
MIEDELVMVFSHLDLSFMIFIEYTPGVHRVFKDELEDVIEKMPPKFSTKEDAIAYGNIIMSRCWHFINIL